MRFQRKQREEDARDARPWRGENARCDEKITQYVLHRIEHMENYLVNRMNLLEQEVRELRQRQEEYAWRSHEHGYAQGNLMREISVRNHEAANALRNTVENIQHGVEEVNEKEQFELIKKNNEPNDARVAEGHIGARQQPDTDIRGVATDDARQDTADQGYTRRGARR